MDKKQRKYRINLHIHTCLSPCADLLMTPGNIINKAQEEGIDIIAITDHNSAGNVKAMLEMAENEPLVVIPGMEVESSEEVHLLCLFEELEKLLLWDKMVRDSLPPEKNDEDYFGYQLFTDRFDQYIAREKLLLANATGFSVKEVVRKVRKLGGVVIPSHVDRPYNSIIANLGFIPPELDISIVEISKSSKPEQVLKKFPFLREYAYIINSDSHSLNSIKAWTEIKLDECSLQGIINALTTM